MSNKQWVLKAIRELEEEATLEEILEHIQIMAKVRQSKQSIKEGRVYTQEEIERLSATWITNPSGQRKRRKTLKK